MNNSSLPAALAQVTASSAKAQADIAALLTAAQQAQASLETALRAAQRGAALAGSDPVLLKDFLAKPYIVRPLGDGQYELIIPRFMGLQAGWPLRHDGAYSVYLVSRFTHFIQPLPAWLAQEFGFAAPTFQGTLEGNTLTITQGDPEAAYSKLGGAKTIARREGASLILRPASRFDVLRQIIREEGILPYAPRAVPVALRRAPEVARDDQGHAAFQLREHQARDYRRFLECGAVSVFAYPQTGKSFLALQACAELRGLKLILCPRRSLVEQWKARLALYLTPQAAAEVIVTTYQSAHKFFKQAFALLVLDEAHHAPADFAIEAATTIQTETRLGLSATPRREDGQTELIPALCGWPVGADWPVAAAQRPPVTVWLVKDETAKLRKMAELCARPVSGKTFIFTYRLDIGEKAAKRLQVPFVQGRTKKPLEVIQANDTIVISSIGNEGLSFPVRKIIELDFLYGSAMEAGQRLGRLAFEVQGQDRPGEHHVLMTPAEYQRYGKRLLIYEQWGLDLDLRVGDESSGQPVAVAAASRRKPARVRPARPPANGKKPEAAPPADPNSPEALLQNPALAAKITQAEKSIGDRSAPYIRRVFRYCYKAPLSPAEVADGLAITDPGTRSRISSACNALANVGLAEWRADGRLQIRQEEVTRLALLAQLRNQ
jgi:DNA excision repair protein ERCC-3